MSNATALPKSKREFNYTKGDPFKVLTPAQRRRVKHKENKADAHQVIGVAYPSKRKRRTMKPRKPWGGGYGISQAPIIPPSAYGE